MRRLALAGFACALGLIVACLPTPSQGASPAASAKRGSRTSRRQHSQLVRVLLQQGIASARVDATSAWTVTETSGRARRMRAGQEWTISARNGSLSAQTINGVIGLGSGSVTVRPEADGLLLIAGRRYRGEIVIAPSAAGLTVINRLDLEDYLRGVVPRELGARSASEMAAVEAQAIAARSYALTHLAGASRGWDMNAGVTDQVYGGASAETALTDNAVRETDGLVLLYGGRVVNAPYHSTCGGRTAAASEVWREGDEPWLQSVSDQIPGTSRYYCDQAPRFQWTTSFDGAALRALVSTYLKAYVRDAPRSVSGVRMVDVRGMTPSGRVAALRVETDEGGYTLRGNDIRYVLRSGGVGGEILNSTYFSVDAAVVGRDGHLTQLVLRGGGYGHGIGMCQWGAIGRARAGQDYRTILATYYPGTTVGFAP